MAVNKPEERPEEAFIVKPYHDALLGLDKDMPIGIYQLHLASARQLCRLHFSPKSLKRVQALLKELVDHRYLQEDWTPTRRYRSPYHYVLGSEGVRYLKERGKDVSEAFRESKEVPSHSSFIDHHLEVGDVIISAALLKRITLNYRLDTFVRERELAHQPYKATWQGKRFSLIPDAFLEFGMALPNGRHARMSTMLEHDRGTEEQRSFRSKVRKYIVLLKDHQSTESFGRKGMIIAFTTFVGESRLKQMRTWASQELASTNESKAIGLRFLFATIPRETLTEPDGPRRLWLESCWYTSSGEQPLALLEV